MGTFKIKNIVLKALFNKPATKITAEQPIITKDWFENTRGHIDIDINECILCGMCMRKCPTNAITVDRAGATWEIQRMQCIQCGHCAEVCPKSCLSVAPDYTEPGVEKVIDKFDIPQQEKPAAPAKPAEEKKDEPKADAPAAAPAEEPKADAPAEEPKADAPAEVPVEEAKAEEPAPAAAPAAEGGVQCNKDACVLCGACVGACPVGALSVDGEWQINRDTCVQCGACVGTCPVGALSMA